MSDQTRYHLFSGPKRDLLLQIDTWTGDTWYLVAGVKNGVKWYGWKMVLSASETDRREREALEEEARRLLEKTERMLSPGREVPMSDAERATLHQEVSAFLAREEHAAGE
jgi:hypothetical protein